MNAVWTALASVGGDAALRRFFGTPHAIRGICRDSCVGPKGDADLIDSSHAGIRVCLRALQLHCCLSSFGIACARLELHSKLGTRHDSCSLLRGVHVMPIWHCWRSSFSTFPGQGHQPFKETKLGKSTGLCHDLGREHRADAL